MDPAKKILLMEQILFTKRLTMELLKSSRNRSKIITKLDGAALWLGAEQIKGGETSIHHQTYLGRG
jgi:hypothetical protein